MTSFTFRSGTAARRLLSRSATVKSVSLVMVLVSMLGASAAAGSATSPGTGNQVAALVAASVKINSADSAVMAALPASPYDTADRAFKIPALCQSATACIYGDTAATKTVVLMGNSHARMWLPALNPVAVARHLKLVVLGKNSCPVVTLNLSAKIYPGCNPIVATDLAVINALKPSLVILADRTVGTPYTSTTWQKGMATSLASVKKSGAKEVVVGDIQEFNLSPAPCVASYATAVQTHCSVPNPNPKQHGLESAEKAATQNARAVYVDPTKWLCTKSRCSPIIGDFVAYWGADHVSATYAAYLSGVMGDALKSTLDSL